MRWVSRRPKKPDVSRVSIHRGRAAVRSAFAPEKFGSYVLLSRLGRGGMAEVYRAKSIGAAGFQKDVALKRILPNLAEDDHFVSMFIDEAKVMVSLDHPNIIQVYELGKLDGHFFIAMEYVQGRDLLDVLASSVRNRQALPRETVLFIVSEMLRGLHYAHEARDAAGQSLGLVHRDVSPSNILIGYSGRTRIGDFGIARSTLQSRHTEAGTQKGKVGYMSPEQVRGEAIDRRSDIFAVGVVLFEMLTMSRLFKARSEFDALLRIRNADIDDALQQHAERLDADLIRILKRAITRQPDERYATAQAMLRDVLEYASSTAALLTPDALSSYMEGLFGEDIEADRLERMGDARAIRAILQPREAVYRVRHPRGDVHGPFNFAAMVEWHRHHTVSEEHTVSYDGARWMAFDRFPEFAGFLREDAPEATSAPRTRAGERRQHTAMTVDWEDLAQLVQGAGKARVQGSGGFQVVATRERAAVRPPTQLTPPPPLFALPDRPTAPAEGSLERVRVSRLYAHLHETKATGVLRLRQGELGREVYFFQGTPEHASALSSQELLGHYLLSKGRLSEAQLKEALRLLRNEGGRLGDALVRIGALTHHQVSDNVQDQFRDKLMHPLWWTEGTWSWYPNEVLGNQAFRMRAAIVPMLVESIRACEDQSALEAWVKPFLRSAIDAREGGPELRGLPWRPQELRVANQMRPGVKIALILDKAGNEMIALRVLYTVVQLGVMDIQGDAALEELRRLSAG